MKFTNHKLVIVSTRGLDDERGPVAWTIANSGLASDVDVMMFSTSAATDLVRRGGVKRGARQLCQKQGYDLLLR